MNGNLNPNNDLNNPNNFGDNSNLNANNNVNANTSSNMNSNPTMASNTDMNNNLNMNSNPNSNFNYGDNRGQFVEKKKKSTFLVVLVVLLSIVVLGLGGYIVYSKFIKPTEVGSSQNNNNDHNDGTSGTETGSSTNDEIIDITGNSLAVELFNNFSVSASGIGDNYTLYYDNITSSDVSDNYLVLYGMFGVLNSRGEAVAVDCATEGLPYSVVSKSELQDYIKNKFNIDRTLNVSSFTYRDYTVTDAGDSFHITVVGCKSSAAHATMQELYKAEQQGDNVYLYVKTLYTAKDAYAVDYADDISFTNTVNKCSIDPEKDATIYECTNSESVSVDLADGTMLERYGVDYKVTFTKASNGNYYWTSTTKVN